MKTSDVFQKKKKPSLMSRGSLQTDLGNETSFKLVVEVKQGRSAFPSCTHLDAEPLWSSARACWNVQIWSWAHLEISPSLSLLSLSLSHLACTFPLISLLSLFALPSFSPSASQGQPSAHGEQGCSRRHFWKRAPAAKLSSVAVPEWGWLKLSGAIYQEQAGTRGNGWKLNPMSETEKGSEEKNVSSL